MEVKNILEQLYNGEIFPAEQYFEGRAIVRFKDVEVDGSEHFGFRFFESCRFRTFGGEVTGLKPLFAGFQRD